jgi:TRAP-type C4-dicarboxylate transport system substrate-binding protein
MINGVIGGPLSCECDAGFDEVCSYFLETPLTPVDSWCILINLDAWNELPEDLQMLIYESVSYAANIFTASYFVHDLWAREKIVDMGYTITTLPESEQVILRQYMLEILDKYSEEDPVYFAKATEILKDYLRSLGLLD